MISRPVQLLGVALGVGALFVTAYLMIMTTFMVYDDEGFVLITLRNFLAGGALYDSVFSQYGPVPYVYHLILTLGGAIELTHTFGRILTAIHWVTCAVAVGWMVSSLVTKHRGLVGCFAAAITFSFLWQMVAEPTHPGSMIAAIVAVSSAFGVRSIQRAEYTNLAVIVGVAGALLFLTKINVGAFFIAGAGAFALWTTDWPTRWRKPARSLAVAGLVALPWLLMSGNLGQIEIFGFALKASLAAAGVFWVSPPRDDDRRIRPQVWWYAVGSFALISGIAAGVVVLRGTSVSALVDAVLWAPLRQPSNFVVGPLNEFPGWIISIVAWGIAGLAGWELRQNGKLRDNTARLVAGFRLMILAAFIVNALRWASPWGTFVYLDIVLPLLPIWLVPLQQGHEKSRVGLHWLALISLPQVMHAYPVVGSQIGWGSFLSLGVVAIGLADLLQSNLRQSLHRVRLGVASVAIVAAFSQTALLAKIGYSRYTTSQPLGLPGAESIRVDDATRITMRSLVQNISVHADSLVTRPGMYSLNIWSETPTPTAQNATHWFWLLDDSEQLEIVNQLKGSTRPLLVSCTPLEEFLERYEIPMQGRLQDYLEQSFAKGFALKHFEISHPKGQSLTPFGTVTFFDADEDQAGEQSVSFINPIILNGTPRTVEVVQFDYPDKPRSISVDLEGLRITPIRRNGDAMAASQLLPDVQKAQGLFVLEGTVVGPISWSNFANRGLIILDENDEVLAESLF